MVFCILPQNIRKNILTKDVFVPYNRTCVLRRGFGEVSEWLKELASKSSVSVRSRGFESHPFRYQQILRQIRYRLKCLAVDRQFHTDYLIVGHMEMYPSG
jgi:hypothetical protein